MGIWAFLGIRGGGEGDEKGLFWVLLCVAFPNFLLRGLDFWSWVRGGYFWMLAFRWFRGKKGLERIFVVLMCLAS